MAENKNINNNIVGKTVYLKAYNAYNRNKFREMFCDNNDEFTEFSNLTFSQQNLNMVTNITPLSFAVYSQESKTNVGIIKLCKIFDNVISVEYAIYEKYRKSGFAFDAVSTLLGAVRAGQIYENSMKNERVCCERIIAVVSNKNLASVGLIEKLGFEIMGKSTAMQYLERFVLGTNKELLDVYCLKATL